jgi:hypothetical protein
VVTQSTHREPGDRGAAEPMLIERLLPDHDAGRAEHRVMPGSPETVFQDPPAEIAFGVVGRFWAGDTTWEQIDAAEFRSFDRPGLAKIACNFSLRPYGSAHTLVSYECRTKATDEESRAGFMRYWTPLSPFIGVVLRAQLGVIAADLAVEH